MSAVPAAEPVKESVKLAESSLPVAVSSEIVAAPTADKPKLSAAELKKQKTAEKAARRAKVIEKKGQAGANTGKGKEDSTATTTSAVAEKTQSKASEQPGNDDKVRSSSNGKNKQGVIHQPSANSSTVSSSKQQKSADLWSHLPTRKMSNPTAEDLKDIHPKVRILGLQMLSYDVLGSNQRLVAMLTVLKYVIREYETPAGKALTRHLMPQVLSPQITHLASCRPLSISQGNAIRWLKIQISKIDVNTPEDEAKKFLCTSIEEFIRDKSTLAHKVIAEKGAEKINTNDVVLTYGYSAVVEKTIRKAWADGKRFTLQIIDTDPYGEGMKLAEALHKNEDLKGIDIKFGQYNAVGNFIDKSTKVFLGAHAMMSNGCLYSRVGTAGVACDAHFSRVPVVVLCESVKFSSRAPLTAYEHNELAPVCEMIRVSRREREETDLYSKPKEVENEGHRLFKGTDDAGHRLEINDMGVKAINFMFDLTPAEYINMVISEHGAVPPTSVPVLNRLYNEANEDQ